ncbi:MAG TPA: HD domain-containing phosphohydrolase [Candidatus Acidoferrales bacterium]|jgi:HD-GYP domain-containing protein (c-di-GMP phosphodiesterase class II)|nr:HD domain-containing phosphohydrolase [Candidatus Acidoferrales bacterium]
MRALPVIAFFEDDPVAARYFHEVQRFRRIPFPQAVMESPEVECIVLLSREHFMDRHYAQLRVPNVRVLALSDRRFVDPRNDGAVYAYLPADVSEVLLDRMVDNALDHIHLVHTRHEVNQRLAGASQEIHELNQIGVALSAEHDPERLLDLILTKSREFTASDAGSLYLVEEAEAYAERRSLLFGPALGGEIETPATPDHPRRLRFKLAQNDSVKVAFREVTMDVDEKSIAGYVALTGEIVNIADAYELPAGVPYSINRSFDHESGYHTRSILAVPIRNQKDKIIGVLQLINAKRSRNARLDSQAAIEEQVVPFTAHQQEIVLSLASQAAVAYENSHLYDNIHRLFEGFVRASVTAIETRDPATSGHSFRVANLTLALAEAVDHISTGPYAPVRFTRDQMREMRYASLLHDFGKVGVPEEVLVKATKLYPAQVEVIRQRFAFVRRTLEAEVLSSKVKYLLEKSREEFLAAEPRLDGQLADALRELDEHFKAVILANQPSVVPEGNFDRLLDIRNVQYRDLSGESKPLLSDEEVRLLSIPQGSLDEAERLQIEAHVIHTVSFLRAIPWTNELQNVPEIARAHHEKLNGTGYPYKLSAAEIPLQTRMMTISDIFDALAAADRPYKKAVSVERALEILDLSVKDGELDPNLFEIFKGAEIYHRWKVEAQAY